eukprot:1085906-Rhodomonas_salina.4
MPTERSPSRHAPMPFLQNVRYWPRDLLVLVYGFDFVLAYRFAMGRFVLTSGMLLPGVPKSIRHRHISRRGLPASSTDHEVSSLYAMSGTNLPCRHIRLRACYAMSGTDLLYRATTQGPVLTYRTAY